ncbi:lipase family protein [Mycolicibacterium goodii]|uniref:lipase family protein n=1 Tax=Mycolicibacterium goodii TaxID=134601 RepID=UPI001BDCB692|nr:lipase family protein [Mycolicibacterium goodii]MBU8812828.1 lipase family protein [Mycolicibacterium goodii]ULN49533.1 lipase family protein [Mycolicibacterium goodii]
MIVALCAVVSAPITSILPVAGADESRYLAFYTPPDPLPAGAPGDLIRTEPSRLVLEPSGQLGSFVGTGTRIMYRSTDAQGRDVAVTGTYIEPHVPWPGSGPRPLLAYATAPYGMGEQCAPSRLFNQGIHTSLDTGFDLMFNLEEGFIATLLARGYAIVVTDGVGLGVHGPMAPQFLNRVAGGTALNDAARAAMRLPDTTLQPDGPVAFWGWLAGGHAALAAAELAGTYAPELNIVGTYANGATTDLPSMLPPLDGNQLAGSIGWVLRGIQEAYPDMTQPIADSLTPRGVEMLANTSRQCMVQTGINYAFRHLQPWFKDDLYQSVQEEPLKSILAMQRIGNVKPTGPVYLSHNRWDSFAPYESIVATARDWCALGADVTLWTNEQPPFLNKMNTNALLTAFVDGERSMAWIADRFNGVPTTPNCS